MFMVNQFLCEIAGNQLGLIPWESDGFNILYLKLPPLTYSARIKGGGHKLFYYKRDVAWPFKRKAKPALNTLKSGYRALVVFHCITEENLLSMHRDR